MLTIARFRTYCKTQYQYNIFMIKVKKTVDLRPLLCYIINYLSGERLIFCALIRPNTGRQCPPFAGK